MDYKFNDRQAFPEFGDNYLKSPVAGKVLEIVLQRRDYGYIQ